MSTEKAKEIDKINALKGRIASAKPLIPKPYMAVYEFMHGPQSKEKRDQIRQAYNLRLSEVTILEEITKNFEQLAKKNQKNA